MSYNVQTPSSFRGLLGKEVEGCVDPNRLCPLDLWTAFSNKRPPRDTPMWASESSSPYLSDKRRNIHELNYERAKKKKKNDDKRKGNKQ